MKDKGHKRRDFEMRGREDERKRKCQLCEAKGTRATITRQWRPHFTIPNLGQAQIHRFSQDAEKR